MHPFELAGLGKAPFRYVGSYVSKFQAVPGDPSCPVQPGSSCDYCAAAIMNVCRVRDAEGKEFKVGCDCVAKTADKKLVDAVKRAVNKARTAQANARADAQIETAKVALADERVRAKLAAIEHKPSTSWQHAQSRLEWAEWMMANAGRTGKLAAAKFIAALGVSK